MCLCMCLISIMSPYSNMYFQMHCNTIVTYHQIMKKESKSNLTYIFLPWSQKSNPKINEAKSICRERIKLYDGLLQYDKCCFHKQALN